MPTAIAKKTSTALTSAKKSRAGKSSVSKETLALFGESSREEPIEEVVSTIEKPQASPIKKTSNKATKKEEKSIVEEQDENALDSSDTDNSPEVSVNNSETVPSKKEVKTAAVESIQKSSIAVKETEKSKEKSSLFSSFFSKKAAKEDEKSEDSSSNRRTEEKVTISEPVKATPIAQRKIADEKKLSTFGLSKERDQFIENLSMLVLSGMSIIGALSSIIKQTKSPGMKAILERMLLEIESGSPVWKALDKTHFFKGYTISLIRLGEESGNFAENLKVVALEEEKDREFKSKVKSALMYPIFVLGLTGIVGIGISWFILPKLAKIFYDLKLALPLITKVLLAFGLFLSKHGLVAVPLGAAVIGAVGYLVFGWSKTKFIGEAIIFSIPGIKTLLMEVEVARFGYLLGTLLEAGLPVTRAIDSLASASEVIRYKKFYLALRESIDAGNSFEKSFAAYKNINALIPPPVQQLIISGEQSGNLNKTLIKVGQVLEAKSDTTTKNLTIIMEPILLVIVWAGVVSVAFAVILPIYSLVGGLNTI